MGRNKRNLRVWASLCQNGTGSLNREFPQQPAGDLTFLKALNPRWLAAMSAPTPCDVGVLGQLRARKTRRCRT
jgi:hypothetical protein